MKIKKKIQQIGQYILIGIKCDKLGNYKRVQVINQQYNSKD